LRQESYFNVWQLPQPQDKNKQYRTTKINKTSKTDESIKNNNKDYAGNIDNNTKRIKSK
jgi:hypothetical protein